MLPTFVIGLREGLEAALIVSIIATFLRRNGAPLRPMWIGVSLAVLLSIGVGVTLKLVERSLPQDKQEMLETVIGWVAVFFVTGMVLWMRTHARFLKRELEGAAEAALGDGTAVALAAMAFLAVLREGFETSVFLLATFQVASTTGTAAAGATLGILVALVIGYGIYRGGIRLNLGRFFTVTSVFLVFVAAGLVLGSLRTAHEAGWVTIGQGTTVDLSWLAPGGSIRAALVTGVLGIPSDPRVIEVLAWVCYLVPVLLMVVWPARHRPGPEASRRLRWTLAGAATALAAGLLLLVPVPRVHVADSAPLEGGGTVSFARTDEGATLTVERDGATSTVELTDRMRTTLQQADTEWTAEVASHRIDGPAQLTLTELLAYTGNRVPVGLDVRSAPGPYQVTWTQKTTNVLALSRDGGLVSASASGGVVATLTGTGLTSPRVITIDDPSPPVTWKVPDAHVAATSQHLRATTGTADDRMLWKHWVPIALLVTALGLALANLRQRRGASAPASSTPIPTPPPAATGTTDPEHAPTGRKTHANT